jgi:hypothetical protein
MRKKLCLDNPQHFVTSSRAQGTPIALQGTRAQDISIDPVSDNGFRFPWASENYGSATLISYDPTA